MCGVRLEVTAIGTLPSSTLREERKLLNKTSESDKAVFSRLKKMLRVQYLKDIKRAQNGQKLPLQYCDWWRNVVFPIWSQIEKPEGRMAGTGRAETKGIVQKRIFPSGQNPYTVFYLRVFRVRPEYREDESWRLLYDNASSHRSTLLTDYLIKNHNLTINHFPIQMIWDRVKSSFLENAFTHERKA